MPWAEFQGHSGCVEPLIKARGVPTTLPGLRTPHLGDCKQLLREVSFSFGRLSQTVQKKDHHEANHHKKKGSSQFAAPLTGQNI